MFWYAYVSLNKVSIFQVLNIFKVYKSMLWQIYIVLNDLSKNIRFVYILILQLPIRLYICILHAFIHASPLRVYMYIEIILHVTWSDGQAVCGVLVMTGRKTSVWFSHTRLMIYEVQNNIYKKTLFLQHFSETD